MDLKELQEKGQQSFTGADNASFDIRRSGSGAHVTIGHGSFKLSLICDRSPYVDYTLERWTGKDYKFLQEGVIDLTERHVMLIPSSTSYFTKYLYEVLNELNKMLK